MENTQQTKKKKTVSKPIIIVLVIAVLILVITVITKEEPIEFSIDKSEVESIVHFSPSGITTSEKELNKDEISEFVNTVNSIELLKKVEKRTWDGPHSNYLVTLKNGEEIRIDFDYGYIGINDNGYETDRPGIPFYKSNNLSKF